MPGVAEARGRARGVRSRAGGAARAERLQLVAAAVGQSAASAAAGPEEADGPQTGRTARAHGPPACALAGRTPHRTHDALPAGDVRSLSRRLAGGADARRPGAALAS